MTRYRPNSVVIDFNVMPVRPDINSVTKFITQVLKLNLKRTRNLQFNNSRNHVIIELETPEEAAEFADNHNLKHKIGYRSQGYAIPIFIEDNAIQVRVHDLPPHMPTEVIVAHLEAYGEVKSIRNEVWRDYFPGVPNGVRAVRMVVKKPIPSFIKVQEDLAYITHKDQKKTCRYCSKLLHPGQKCIEAEAPIHITKPAKPTEQQETEQIKQQIENNTVDISTDEDSDDKGQASTHNTMMTRSMTATSSTSGQDADQDDKRSNENNNKRSGSPTLQKVHTSKRKENSGQQVRFFRRIDGGDI